MYQLGFMVDQRNSISHTFCHWFDWLSLCQVMLYHKSIGSFLFTLQKWPLLLKFTFSTIFELKNHSGQNVYNNHVIISGLKSIPSLSILGGSFVRLLLARIYVSVVMESLWSYWPCEVIDLTTAKCRQQVLL